MASYQRTASGYGHKTRRAEVFPTRPVARASGLPARRMPLRNEAAALPIAEQAADRLPWPVVVFLIALIVPWIISVGPLRLSPYRVVLLVMIVPCFLRLISGKAGPIRAPDVMVILFSVWAMVCLAAVHGLETALQGGGILFVETAGAYLLARAYIRTADQFRSMVALLFKIVVFLLPFGLIEMFTGQKPLLQLLGVILPTLDVTEMDRRWGLWRVQGPFEHPILFGVFCGSVFALTHVVLGHAQTMASRWLKSGIVMGTALLALSSGPLSALAGVCMLLGWNWLLRNMAQRWGLLWGGILAVCLAVYVYSGQSIVHFYVSHAPLFDSWSAYYRLLIWDYGSQTVANHPVFGIGYNEYERPYWMAPSVDMFWLNNGIMFGLPGGLLMAGSLGSAAWLVSRRVPDDPRLSDYKTGYLMSLGFFFLVGWTVHFWNGTYSFFLFMVASGMWLADLPSPSATRGSTGFAQAPPAGDLETRARLENGGAAEDHRRSARGTVRRAMRFTHRRSPNATPTKEE